MNEHDAQERRLDDELAAMTDRYLNERASSVSTDDLRDYDPLLHGLAALLVNEQPSSVFKKRLDQRIDQEWSRRVARPRERQMRFSPIMRMVAAVAIVVVVVGVLAVMSPPDSAAQVGTVVGDIGAGVAIGVAATVIVALAAIVLLRGRRK